MHVAGRHTWLAQLVRNRQDLAVVIAQLFLVLCRAVGNHKLVVANRLNFQIIIEVGNLEQIFMRCAVHHLGKQLACLTGRAKNQALSVTNQFTARHNRLFIEIFQVGIGNQLVQIFESHLIFCQNNKVIPAQIFQTAGLGFESRQQRIDVGNFGRVQLIPHLFQQFDKNSA